MKRILFFLSAAWAAHAQTAARVPAGPLVIVARPSCRRADLLFTEFPLKGTNGRTYFINNYLDLDTGGGLRDYRGQTGSMARTYNGHGGIDIDIANFRRMDTDSAGVYSASYGKVESVEEGQPDRNTVWCPNLPDPKPTWNVVHIRAPNGFLVSYGHLKRNSIRVVVNQNVAPGTLLAIVGSSGCSTDAHLHFQVRDCSNGRVEPFSFSGQPDMWSGAAFRSYFPASNVMDLWVRRGTHSGMTDPFKDPPQSLQVATRGWTIGIGTRVQVRLGNTVRMRLFRPGNVLFTQAVWAATNAKRTRPDLSWTATLSSSLLHIGTWKAQILINGVLKRSVYFRMLPSAVGIEEIAVIGVHHDDYPKKFAQMTEMGYRPAAFDGYNMGADAYVNAIFKIGTQGSQSWHSLTWQTFNNLKSMPAGWRPTNVESYLVNGVRRYQLTRQRLPGPAFHTYHGLTQVQYSQRFNLLRNLGWRPKQVSVVSVGGNRYFTGLWEKQSIGSWNLQSYVRMSDYQAHYNTQTAGGRRPMWLNTYTHNGIQYIACLFASSVPASHNARHGMTALFADLYSRIYNNRNTPQMTRTLTGYVQGKIHKFAGSWD